MHQTFAASQLTVRTLADSSLELAVAAFNAGFAGYLVPILQTPAQFDARFRAEHGDPFASTLYCDADEPVAILMISRRGCTSRVAAMGIAPQMRGTGLGLQMIERAVTEAGARGDTRLVLEVIETNERAVKLYERAGFAIVRPLWGFSIDAGTAAPSDTAPAIEIDPALGSLRAGAFATPDLPWQIQVPTLAAMVRPTRCFTDASRSIVAMADATQDTVRLRALAFDPHLSPTDSAPFTAALRATFPGRAWFAPPIFPEAHRAQFFTPGGWTTIAMRQFEMRHALAAD